MHDPKEKLAQENREAGIKSNILKENNNNCQKKKKAAASQKHTKTDAI